jgi:hypothetical protein
MPTEKFKFVPLGKIRNRKGTAVFSFGGSLVLF